MSFFGKLQFKFMLTFLTVAIIPGVLFSASTYYILSNKAIKESLSEAQLLLNQIKKTMDTHLDEMQRVALIPNFDYNIQQSLQHPKLIITENTKPDESLYSTMNVFTQFNFLPYTSGVSIFHTDGTLLYSQYYSKTNTQLKQRLSSVAWFTRFSGADSTNHYVTKREDWPELHIVRDSTNQYYENWAFSYVQKLYSYPGKVYNGALVIDINKDMFRYIFDDVINRLHSNYVVYDPKSREVLYQNTNLYSSEKLKALLSGDSSLAAELEAEDVVYQELDGERVLVSKDTLSRTGWEVMSLIPRAEIVKGANVILYTIIIVLIVCTMLTLLLSISFSRRLTKPILDLQTTMEKVEQGNLNIRYNVIRRDELGLLGKSFNRMLDQLDKYINKYFTLEVLRSQINPHFLYNSLATISSIAKVKNITEIHIMASSLARLFRYSINQTDRELVTFEEEIDIMKSYIEAQKIRFGAQIQVHWDIEEELSPLKTIKLVLQPILENAFAHGIEPKGKGDIRIAGKIHRDDIQVIIEDTGMGMPYEYLQRMREQLETPILGHEFKKSDKKGVGLANVNQRLRLSFGASYGIHVDSTPGIGTKVTLYLPIIRV